MMKTLMMTVFVVVALCARGVMAQNEHEQTTAPSEHRETTETAAGPQVSEDASWAGVMLLVIMGLFLSAAVIGPVVRLLSPEPEPVPDMHGHDAHDHGALGHGHGH